MRVGATLLLLDGYCYQSYNWQILRPLGKLQNAVDILEQYQCDEISIIRPIRDKDDKTFLNDIKTVANLKSLTPISFGGGLRSQEHIDMLHKLPIERLIFSTPFIEQNTQLLQYAKSRFGNQAIQALLPFKELNNQIYIFHSANNSFIPLEQIDISFIDKYANEVILFDTKHEGDKNHFYRDILNKIDIPNHKIIISGGIGKDDIKFAQNNNLASVAIENKVLHTEYSIKEYKNG